MRKYEKSWKCFGIAIAAIAICVIVVVTALMVTRPWFASSKNKDSFHEVTQSSTLSVPTSQNTTDVTPSETSEGTSTATTFPTTGPCKNGIEAYPSYLPNSDYYTRLCTTRHDLKVISGSIASNEALEQTASLINSIMDYVDPRADVICVQRWLANFVLQS